MNSSGTVSGRTPLIFAPPLEKLLTQPCVDHGLRQFLLLVDVPRNILPWSSRS
jgi:hypothetical protein